MLERAVEPGRLGLMTHFASAEDPDAGTTELQIRALYEIADMVDTKRVSLANSAGLLGDWSCHHEGFQSLARPGIMLWHARSSPHRRFFRTSPSGYISFFTDFGQTIV